MLRLASVLCLIILLAGCRSITVAGKSTADEVLINHVQKRCKQGKCGKQEIELLLDAYINQTNALKIQTGRNVQLQEEVKDEARSTSSITKWLLWSICIIGVLVGIALIIYYARGFITRLLTKLLKRLNV